MTFGESVLTAEMTVGYCNYCTMKHQVERITGGDSLGNGLAAPILRSACSVKRGAMTVKS
jgi:hypothetical protein